MKRTLAPALLFLLAAVSLGGVFEVHRLERGDGPVGQPFISPAFSPNDDGVRDEAELLLRVDEPHAVRVDVVDDGDRVVRRLARRTVAAGPTRFTWDGREDEGDAAPEGTYRFHIRLDGARRRFEPPRGVRLDLRPPPTGDAFGAVRTRSGIVAVRFAAPYKADVTIFVAGRERTYRVLRRSGRVDPEIAVDWFTTIDISAGGWRDEPVVVEVRDAAGNAARVGVRFPGGGSALPRTEATAQ